ncbi:exopolysaccharide production protein ExoZ [Paraburkholderia sp. BL6669N2]|uniref:acyltransferase family protein n=1 Tax=Paraburkholderia sp. BL6669N2 TaxID=1938807 RepID=UPI000E284BD6|nr:acyltransferase [Paraburkholderia sp. BL6669N2]REG58945.1 exopolysaccharide production protein ExoZ [Paraburkholderia sp. BL6669N2]
MKKIEQIQYLRALAALLVVAYHAPATIAGFSDSLPQLSVGAFGVDIFFVISGFIMGSLGETGQGGRVDFLLKRIVRIVPMYWLVTLVTVGLAFIAPHLMRSTVVDISSIVKSLLFIPHFSLGHPGSIWPIVVPGWTLSYEMFFYAVFALVISGTQISRATLLSVVFVALIIGGLAIRPSDPIALTYTSTLLFEFVMGLWIAIAYRRGVLPSHRLACVLVVVAVLLLWGSGTAYRGINKGVPAAAIVLGSLVILNRSRWPLLGLIGDASYSIYLMQFFSFGVTRALWVASGIGSSEPLYGVFYVAFSSVGCIVTGVATYWFVERPITAYLGGIVRRRSMHQLRLPSSG